jgi:hypothetical protein
LFANAVKLRNLQCAGCDKNGLKQILDERERLDSSLEIPIHKF